MNNFILTYVRFIKVTLFYKQIFRINTVLNGELNDTIDNKITTSFEIGTITESTGNKLAIRSGVRIIAVNGSSAVLFTKNQLYDMFQTTQGWPNNFCACVMNGDGIANAAHIDGTTNSESSLKVVLDRSQSNALLRVCYTIFYWY